MPIQPRFSLTQDAEAVILLVRVPHVRVSSTEIDIDGPALSVFCPPYLLKLVLPGQLVDDERARASYDPHDAGGTLTVRAPQATPGEHFADLDLAARLLAPPPRFPTATGAGGGEGAAATAAAASLAAPSGLGEGGGGGEGGAHHQRLAEPQLHRGGRALLGGRGARVPAQ